MAIGLLRLALGPVASDTQWDIEGSGVPAAAVAVAAGWGRRAGEARAGARDEGSPRRRPPVVGSQGSGTRPGAAAAIAGPPRGCLASLRHRPSGSHSSAAFVGAEGGLGDSFLSGREVCGGPRGPTSELWIPADAGGRGPGVGASVPEPGPAWPGLGAFLWPIGAGSAEPQVFFVWLGGGSARVGRDLHTSWWDRVESLHSDKGQTVSRKGRGGRDTRGSRRAGGGVGRRDASASGQGSSLPGPAGGDRLTPGLAKAGLRAQCGNSLSPAADISPRAGSLPLPRAASVLDWLCAKFDGRVQLCFLLSLHYTAPLARTRSYASGLLFENGRN